MFFLGWVWFYLHYFSRFFLIKTAFSANSYVPYTSLGITILKEINKEIQEKHKITKKNSISAKRSLYQKESAEFTRFIAESFEKEHSENKGFIPVSRAPR